MRIYESMDWLFSPILSMSPIASIFAISLIVSIISTLAYKYLTDQAVMRETKDSMKKLQQEIKNTDDTKKMSELQKQVMKLNLKYMSFSMKPMFLTLVPFIVIFSWLRHTFEGQTIISFPFSMPLIGNSLGWLGTYIIFSFILTTVLRKTLKVV